jgi:DNA-binding winged helix-turn-helix (wHTH) protein/TolB-like protein/Flp pilus assembly protein TadD
MANPPDKCLYEFAAFRLDPFKRMLTREAEPVALTSKAFELLLALLEQRGQVVGKDELMARLWPDTIVEENNLTVNMTTLRKALGESTQQPRFIITIPGRGYRFIAEVNEVWPDVEDLIVEKHARAHIVVEHEESEGVGEAKSLALRPALRSPSAIILSAGVALIALLTLAIWFRPTNKSSPTINSLAVLPFQAAGVAAGDEYLGLGMADALITRLSNLNQLAVRPTSAVRQYVNQTTATVAAGRALRVDAVLEGNIRRLADRVRVTVQLVRTSDGQPLWAGKFDEQLTDLFAVEDSISAKVVEALTLKLTREQRQLLAKRYTENTEAYQAYLKGRYYWDKRSLEGYRKGSEFFERAIAIDPNYALAYAGLADCLVFGGLFAPKPTEQMLKAETAAKRALALDDLLAEAHTSLAFIKERFYWDRAGAVQAYQRALQLDPSYATAHDWYGLYLAEEGRLAEAQAELKRAQELDPLSPVLNMDLAWAFVLARQYEQAVAECRKAIELEPNFVLAHAMLGTAYKQQGAPEQMLAAVQKAVELAGRQPRSLTWLASAYVRSGRIAEARELLGQLETQTKQGLLLPYHLAAVYASLGEREQAFAQLEQAYADRSSWLVWLKVDPSLESLRADPRFADLQRRVGLAQ